VDDADPELESGPEPLCDSIRGPHADSDRKLTATAVPNHYDTKEITGPKVYQNALVHRLQKQAIRVMQNHPLSVYDEDGTVLGEFFADLFIENILIVELKAVRALVDEHTAQLLGYLRCSRIEHGLLVNFGAPRFSIKKYVLSDALLE
jgi:GxxExxY protein